jgi:hypothetical protein
MQKLNNAVPNETVRELASLMKQAAEKNDLYTQVAASRAIIALYKHYPASLQSERFVQTVEEVEVITQAAAKMLGMHLTSEWARYRKSLGWLSRFLTRNSKNDWMDLQRRTLKMRAVSTVHAILVKNFPEGMSYKEVARLFTKDDLKSMETGLKL